MPKGEGVSKVRVNVKHDIHGMFHVQSAEMMKEVVKVRKSFFCPCVFSLLEDSFCMSFSGVFCATFFSETFQSMFRA